MTDAPNNNAPIGVEGLKSFLEEAARTLGHVRLIVRNMEAGAILEAVVDFSKATFKEQPPAPHGLILTMNIADSCECHVNLEAVCQIQFAQRQTSYLMHVIRLINKGGQTGLTLVLHTCNKKDYEEPESGNPEAWEALKAKYGGLDVIQVQS